MQAATQQLTFGRHWHLQICYHETRDGYGRGMRNVIPIRRKRAIATPSTAALCIILGGIGFGAATWLSSPPTPGRPASRSSAVAAQPLLRCGPATSTLCVIDGDTFRMNGETIRIADIDAPETGNAKCESEAKAGAEATRALAVLLAAGRIELRSVGSRDRDQYGRLLRSVFVSDRSAGSEMIRAGHARPWEGRRRPWC